MNKTGDGNKGAGKEGEGEEREKEVVGILGIGKLMSGSVYFPSKIKGSQERIRRHLVSKEPEQNELSKILSKFEPSNHENLLKIYPLLAQQSCLVAKVL